MKTVKFLLSGIIVLGGAVIGAIFFLLIRSYFAYEVGDCLKDGSKDVFDEEVVYQVVEVGDYSYLLDNFKPDDLYRFVVLSRRLVNKNFVKTTCPEGDANETN